MNIMHNKTEKFITQLSHAHGGCNTANYPIQISASQPAQVTMLQMFKVTSTRFHAATQTFTSPIDSVVTRRSLSLKPVKRRRLPICNKRLHSFHYTV